MLPQGLGLAVLGSVLWATEGSLCLSCGWVSRSFLGARGSGGGGGEAVGLYASQWFSRTQAFSTSPPEEGGGGSLCPFPSQCSQCLAGLSMINHVTLSDHIASQASCKGSVAQWELTSSYTCGVTPSWVFPPSTQRPLPWLVSLPGYLCPDVHTTYSLTFFWCLLRSYLIRFPWLSHLKCWQTFPCNVSFLIPALFFLLSSYYTLFVLLIVSSC